MYFINGSYVKEEDAKISVLDLGILRGFAVFDYLRTYQGRPFQLHDHLLRFQYSAKQIGLKSPYTLQEMEEILLTLLANRETETSLKVVLTGGVSPDQLMPEQNTSFIAFAYPLTPPPSDYYSTGIKVSTIPFSRSLPTCKTTQYMPAIVALHKGRSNNIQEALYLNGQNAILEATTSNFFGVKEGALYTCCSDEVLTGITREVILKLASNHFPIRQEAILYEELGGLSEAFLTSSNKEVMPIVQIDDVRIGNGSAGPITKEITRLFQEYSRQQIWPALDIPLHRM